MDKQTDIQSQSLTIIDILSKSGVEIKTHVNIAWTPAGLQQYANSINLVDLWSV